MSRPVLVELLRAPGEIARRCREDDGLREVALVSLLAVVAGGLVFGGVVGSFRGGAQIAFAALKVPMVTLLSLALAVPAFHALGAALGRPWAMRRVAALALAAAGRHALVLFAFAPVLWLVMDLGLGYHASSLLAAFVYGLAGLAAVGVLVRGLGAGPGQWLTTAAFVCVFFAVGSQSAWILRPYLSRPSRPVVFVRHFEGGVLDALGMSLLSANGVYLRDREEWEHTQQNENQTRWDDRVGP